MTLEVLRVDPDSTIPIAQPWAGWALRGEQRDPVVGDGYQLWSISRATSSPISKIIEGMPMGPPRPTVDSFAQWLSDPLPERMRLTGGRVTLAEAYVFAVVVQRAEGSTLVDGRLRVGIAGAVAGFQWWRDVLRADGKV